MATKQTEANKKWQEKNKEHAKYLSDRSRARNFLKKRVKIEDLEEFKTLIVEREKELDFYVSEPDTTVFDECDIE